MFDHRFIKHSFYWSSDIHFSSFHSGVMQEQAPQPGHMRQEKVPPTNTPPPKKKKRIQ